MASRSTALESELSQHGIVTDLARLLRARHWAQHLKLFSRQAAKNMLLGNLRSRFRGRGMEFEEVRRYQPGDDIRTIDWKVSARAGDTFTKLFREERERPCHIIVDQRSQLYFGSNKQFKSVLAAELAAGIAWAALAGGDRVGGQVIGDAVERDSRARKNKQAVLRLIHDVHELNHSLALGPQAIANTEQNAQSETKPSSIANTLEECRRITRPGTAIFVLSDFHDFDAPAAKALSNLGKHTDLSLIQIVDPIEQNLPQLGRAAISDGHDSQTVTISKKLQQAYQQQLETRQETLIAAATQARALFASVSTTESARQVLSKIFSR